MVGKAWDSGHIMSEVREQIEVRAMCGLLASFYSAQAMVPPGTLEVGYIFLEIPSWTCPEVCFHGESKANQVDDDYEPTQYSWFCSPSQD